MASAGERVVEAMEAADPYLRFPLVLGESRERQELVAVADELVACGMQERAAAVLLGRVWETAASVTGTLAAMEEDR